jgi:hypothetical protein
MWGVAGEGGASPNLMRHLSTDSSNALDLAGRAMRVGLTLEELAEVAGRCTFWTRAARAWASPTAA